MMHRVNILKVYSTSSKDVVKREMKQMPLRVCLSVTIQASYNFTYTNLW